ncbi:uncharacterized protein LOC119720808 isoform X2 [Patiria miniata]|nr:uncharacterized protein LOC119720808 isoform X2 [Patiria miniata]
MYLRHIYRSKPRLTAICTNVGTHSESHTYRWASRSASSGGRSQSLHWDRRETSLMCLKDSARCCSAGPRPSDFSSHQEESSAANIGESKDTENREPPVLFSIERGTITHVLSLLTSSLPVQDGIKDITATLCRLSATMHIQSVYETAAIPWDAACSDDIIIRNNQPIKRHGTDDIIAKQPINKQDYGFANLSSHCLGITQLTDSLNNQPTFGLHRHVCRTHLYFNKVYHVPMVAAVPEPNCLQSSADDRQPATTKADTGLTEQDSSVSPQDNDSQKPSKEQILIMYERLVQELPNFLEDSHDFSMYANSVEFDNRIMKFKTKGLPAYKASVHGMRYLCAAYINGSSMEVLRITAELELGQIQARWRVKGVPLHSYVIRPWRRKHPDRYFDAFSTFELGMDGLIHRHKMDKVMPTPSDKVRAPSLAMRVGIALGLVRNPALAPDCMVPKHLSFMQPKASTGKL